MSECYEEPLTSRVEISAAFQRARSIFPKDFGASSKVVTKDQCSELGDPLSVSKNVKESESNCSILLKSDQAESSLADSSLETVDDTTESFCNFQMNGNCSKNDEGSVLVLLTRNERMDAVYDEQQQQQSFAEESNGAKNDETCNSALQNYTSHQNFDLIWEEIDRSNDIIDSELDESDLPASKIRETPRKYYEASSSSYNTKPARPGHQRRAQSRKSSSSRHSCTHSTPNNEDSSFYHSPSCPYYYYSHCADCHYHHYQQRGCCRSSCSSGCCCHHHHHHHCCGCAVSCSQDLHYNAQQQRVISSSTSSARRRSTKKCSRRQRDASPAKASSSVRHHAAAGSRDSGIFTEQRYAEDGFEHEDDDDYDASSNALLHKDSLAILQEKFAAMGAGRRRQQDDAGVAKSRKICRRLFSRCNSSY